jgi:hypothetical protein
VTQVRPPANAFVALGPIPEVALKRTRDPDRRWLITTRCCAMGLFLGLAIVVSHEMVGVP